jgi:hypothetical protein
MELLIGIVRYGEAFGPHRSIASSPAAINTATTRNAAESVSAPWYRYRQSDGEMPGMKVSIFSTRPRRVHGAILCVLCAAWLGMGTAIAESSSRVVARVFDTEIRLADISPPASHQDRVREKKLAADDAAWLRDYREKRLDARIWQEVTTQAVGRDAVEPTAEEVETFASLSRARRAGRLDESLAQREDLRKKLATGDLSPRKRDQLEKHLATIEKLIAHEREQREWAKTVPNYDEIQRRSSERVARYTIRAWKVNKALYEKYGGRVIFQQAGYEPVDAYRALIADVEKQNAVELLDPSFRTPFARMREYLDMGHNYLPKAAGDEYFAKPWWLKRQ